MIDPTPIKFPEANHDWIKPDEMTDAECASLPAYFDGSTSISCWKLSWRDRIRVLFTGVVWCGVLCRQQPPIWILIKSPIQRVEDLNE